MPGKNSMNYHKKPIYHITHLNNLKGIIDTGGIYSDSERIRRGLDCRNIGYSHIKQKRLSQRLVPVAAGGFLGDYVPFYFGPRSPMLYTINQGNVEGYDEGQEPIVHLVSSIETAVNSERQWAFTDRHAVLGYTDYYDNLQFLDQIDWELMESKYWFDIETYSDRKERRQAEFLIHDFFPWPCITQIGVYSKMVKRQVIQVLETTEDKPEVLIKRNWYY